LITLVVIFVTSIVAITTSSLVMRFPITWSYLMRFWIIFMYLMMLCLPFKFCCVSSWFQINNLLASVSCAMRFSNFFETSQIVHLWDVRNRFHLWLKDWSSHVDIVFFYQQVFHCARVPYQYHVWWCTNDYPSQLGS